MTLWIVVASVLVVLLVVAVVFFTRRQAAPAPMNAASPFPPPPPPLPIPQQAAESPKFDPEATVLYKKRVQSGSNVQRESGVVTGANAIRLEGVSANLRGQSFEIGPGGALIGRGRDADIFLDDQRVSKKHAWIGVENGQLCFRDLGSSNGTFLNANLTTPVAEAKLRDGDLIMLGGHCGSQLRVKASA